MIEVFLGLVFVGLLFHLLFLLFCLDLRKVWLLRFAWWKVLL